jgi:dihydrofolate reductase
MKIALVAAMAENRVIGKEGKMPWHLPAELAYFKAITMGYPVVMGRATYESIGRPLPGRTNIVLSSRCAETHSDERGVIWVNSPAAAIAAAANAERLMVIGGGRVYAEFLPYADELYLTHIQLQTDGDTFFPDYTQALNWHCEVTANHAADANNPHSFYTAVYRRMGAKQPL